MTTIGCRGARGLRATLIVVLLVALALALLPAAWAAPQLEVVSSRTVRVSAVQGQAFPDLAASGQALINLQPGVSNAALVAALEAKGCALLHRYVGAETALVKLPPGYTVPQGVELLQQLNGVSSAEPDRVVYPLLVPNDPLYSQQYQWPLISAPAAWDRTTGSPTTVVAVIDSGIQLDHPDLAAKIWDNPNPGSDPRYTNDLHGWNFIDNNNDPSPLPKTGGDNSAAGHGTHVAGLIGAVTNNGALVAGADWQCKLMSLKVFKHDGSGGTDSVVLKAIEYAILHGANVINLSVGGAYTASYNSIITQAYNAGIVVVAAAGNSSVTFTDSPATWASPVCNDGPNPGDNHVLGVAACDAGKVMASFSNLDGSTRRFVDVTAPGVNILSTWPKISGFTEFSTTTGYASGTSMACPIAAGVAGLLHARFPGASAGAIINFIRNGCSNIDAQNPSTIGKMGRGLVNAVNAMLDVAPPPATNVKAFPTPATPGGSITVTWDASADDNGGMRDVVNYSVRQSVSPVGPFNLVGTVPATGAATYSFIHAPVSNGVPYYYRVDTNDNTYTTPSDVAGPAIARDTIPPPEVTTLTVFDTPADNGGSISLDWAGYTGSPDLAGFHIFRATATFSDISSMSPIATVMNPAARSFQDTPTTDGVQYWYAVTGVDDEGNEPTTVTAAGPVRSFPNLVMNIQPGTSFISLPLTPTNNDMGVILGITETGPQVARWDPTAAAYLTYAANPGAALLRQVAGRGFWVHTATPLTVPLSGLPAPDGNTPMSILPGWNMLGNPYTQPATWGTATVTLAGTTESLDTSNQNGHTSNYAWYYDQGTASYKLISAHLPGQATTVALGQGFWFYSRVTGSLALPRPVGALQEAVSPAPTLPPGSWMLRLVARTAQSADTDNYVGVSPQASSLNGIQSPPLAAGGVDLFFGEEAAPTATSFAEATVAQPTWEIGVTSAQPGAEVTLTWPDLTTLPNSVRPLLTDLATGRSVYLRTCASYSFTAGTAPRRFQLSLAQTSTLALTSVTTTQTSRGAQISYALSAPAQVSVEILNIAGKVIRVVSADRLSPAGLASVVWDGRNATGAAVPAGMYLVRLTATADTGERTTALRPLALAR